MTAQPPPKGPEKESGGLWGDLSDPRLIWLKGALFCVLGLMAATVLMVRRWNAIDAVLCLVTVWAFCRTYYFAFYVIEHYVDAGYRFAGLGSFVRYALKRFTDSHDDASEPKK